MTWIKCAAAEMCENDTNTLQIDNSIRSAGIMNHQHVDWPVTSSLNRGRQIELFQVVHQSVKRYRIGLTLNEEASAFTTLIAPSIKTKKIQSESNQWLYFTAFKRLITKERSSRFVSLLNAQWSFSTRVVDSSTSLQQRNTTIPPVFTILWAQFTAAVPVLPS